MSLTPEPVTAAHGYTREDVPWDLSEYRTDNGKLVQYLSGGGMRTFGRTVAQQKAQIRHRRFYVIAVIFFTLWTLLYFL